MDRAAALVSAAGIDRRQGTAEAAAMLVRRVPLRIGGRDQGTPEQVVECGWCSGIEAFADLLALVAGSPCRRGTAFGGHWPWFKIGSYVVAPALPVRLAEETEEDGPDGAYTLESGGVVREAGGRRRIILKTESTGAEGLPDFTLLWFTDTARFLIRDAVLEVEDLFSRTRCWIDRPRLERLLVRAQRVDGDVIEGLAFENDSRRTTVEVARMLGSTKAPWQDPEAYLQSRIDVGKATVRGDGVVIEDVRGETVEFRMTLQASGWLLERVGGRFPFEALSIQEDEDRLVLKATLADEKDIFSQGLRGRVVFDLNADLTAFLQQHQNM